MLNLIDTWTISSTTSMEVYKDNKWEFKFWYRGLKSFLDV